MSSNYDIVEANVDDITDLVSFGKSEFTRTFGYLYTAKDLEDYLSEAYTNQKYQSWIEDTHYKIWIGRSKETRELLGYILCGVCNLPLENCEGGPYNKCYCGEIKRMYVHPSTFGTGLAQSLMILSMEWLQQTYTEAMFLGVWSENYRAQRFYNKQGFSKVGEYDFPVGEHVDREFIFKLSKSS